jgi:hypothetical protein
MVAGGLWLVEERPSPLVPSHQPPFFIVSVRLQELQDFLGFTGDVNRQLFIAPPASAQVNPRRRLTKKAAGYKKSQNPVILALFVSPLSISVLLKLYLFFMSIPKMTG